MNGPVSGETVGTIATLPDTLFGRDMSDALKDLLETLTRAAAFAAASPEKLESLFRRLGAIEGAAGNLRGALLSCSLATW